MCPECLIGEALETSRSVLDFRVCVSAIITFNWIKIKRAFLHIPTQQPDKKNIASFEWLNFVKSMFWWTWWSSG